MIWILSKLFGLWLLFATLLAVFMWSPYLINGWVLPLDFANVAGLIGCSGWGAAMALLGTEAIKGRQP